MTWTSTGSAGFVEAGADVEVEGMGAEAEGAALGAALGAVLALGLRPLLFGTATTGGGTWRTGFFEGLYRALLTGGGPVELR